VGVDPPTAGLPTEFSLSQNYPNPFNPTTTIEVSLPEQEDLSLRIFDVLGREVRAFEYSKAPAGVHKIVWDGRNDHGVPASSGVYFYRARVGEKVAVHRMLMLK
jgi:flagellar hook assembly protein FlgD